MPTTAVIFYQEGSHNCPILEWLDTLPGRVEGKARSRIERLALLGHQLRRPECDYLQNDIYELRWRNQTVNYRILYFFYGRYQAVLSHGITKEGRIPLHEIHVALRHKLAFEKNPRLHTHMESI